MKYLKLDANKVAIQILYDNDPVFPSIPVTKRFPANILAGYMQIPDDTDVHIGQQLQEDGTFAQPVYDHDTGEQVGTIVDPQPTLAEKFETLQAQLTATQTALDFLLLNT